jgi:hypothetical protein
MPDVILSSTTFPVTSCPPSLQPSQCGERLQVLLGGSLPFAWIIYRSLFDELPQVQDRARRENTYASTPWQRAITKGEIPIFHLPPEEAARRFSFDIGGPQDGVVYVINPCNPNHYLLPALVNERLAQEKLAAFSHIAAALGARTVELVSIDMVKNGGKVGSNAPIPKQIAAQLGLSVDVDAEGRVKRQVFLKCGRPEGKPFVPEHLKVWLTMDPILRSLASCRLEGRIHQMSTCLNFRETIDVRAKLKGQLKKWKLDVGGEYRHVRETSWTFDVEFWP